MHILHIWDVLHVSLSLGAGPSPTYRVLQQRQIVIFDIGLFDLCAAAQWKLFNICQRKRLKCQHGLKFIGSKSDWASIPQNNDPWRSYWLDLWGKYLWPRVPGCWGQIPGADPEYCGLLGGASIVGLKRCFQADGLCQVASTHMLGWSFSQLNLTLSWDYHFFEGSLQLLVVLLSKMYFTSES